MFLVVFVDSFNWNYSILTIRKRRWFELRKESLTYYAQQGEKAKGLIPINFDVLLFNFDKKAWGFSLKTPFRTFYIAASVRISLNYLKYHIYYIDIIIILNCIHQ